MLAKVFASWFVVLILLPFTAPFSTCDLPGPFGHTGRQRMPARRATGVASLNDAAVVPARMMTGRGRLVPLWAPYLAYSGPRSASGVTSVAHPGAPLLNRHALLTILRL
jgi:hypothetical protein